jgi:SAM-dependent methyltransferase
MHLNSELMFKKYANSYFKHGLRVLEVGASEPPTVFCQQINDSSIIWDTLNVDFGFDDQESYTNPRHVTIRTTDPYRYPVPEKSYDIVLSANVMEHVPDIWSWITELKRITKPGGLIITILPNSYPYHPPGSADGCPPTPPQTRTSAINASGSSERRFATI